MMTARRTIIVARMNLHVVGDRLGRKNTFRLDSVILQKLDSRAMRDNGSGWI